MDYSSELENKLKTYIDDPSLAMNPAYNKNLLANRSYQEISEYLSKDKRIILPIGSTEQHGPDGILGVDHITATGIAYTISAVTGILSCPALNYGMAIHHLGFPGSIAMRPTTYINIIVDILTSLKKHGFKEIIVINGHGGNKGPFLNAMQEKYDEFSDLEVKFFNWWVMPKLEKEIIQKEFGEKEGYHATPTEISLTMALIPDRMTMPDSYSCPQKEVPNYNCNWVKPANFRDLYPDGVMKADYSLSTAEIGKKVLESAVKEIIEVI
ncbi:MAG: creatininase family protein [Candidatus Caenarcaniphilales bacterium]|nr:creatininase family protein [Candidatus Caenarcaniphilales bacterium]